MKTVLETKMCPHPNRERDDESATDRKGQVKEGEQVRSLRKSLQSRFIRIPTWALVNFKEEETAKVEVKVRKLLSTPMKAK